jgi:enoyl-[acyl-carrier-protein] reductase (NADH)
VTGALEGRRAVVTGAKANIGAATAQVLAREGARVLLVDVDPAVEETADTIDGEASAYVADLSSSEEVETLAAVAADRLGGIDVGTKAEMHDLIRAEAAAGAAVLLCSTDVDELAEVCDRVVIFFHHEVCATLSGNELRPHAILEAMNSGVAA